MASLEAVQDCLDWLLAPHRNVDPEIIRDALHQACGKLRLKVESGAVKIPGIDAGLNFLEESFRRIVSKMQDEAERRSLDLTAARQVAQEKLRCEKAVSERKLAALDEAIERNAAKKDLPRSGHEPQYMESHEIISRQRPTGARAQRSRMVINEGGEKRFGDEFKAMPLIGLTGSVLNRLFNEIPGVTYDQIERALEREQPQRNDGRNRSVADVLDSMRTYINRGRAPDAAYFGDQRVGRRFQASVAEKPPERGKAPLGDNFQLTADESPGVHVDEAGGIVISLPRRQELGRLLGGNGKNPDFIQAMKLAAPHLRCLPQMEMWTRIARMVAFLGERAGGASDAFEEAFGLARAA